MINVDILRHVEHCSNAFVQPRAKKYIPQRWHDTTVAELYALIGVVIYMGIVHLPEQRHYWGHQGLIPGLGLGTYMSGTRFQRLTRVLRCTEKRGHDQAKFGEDRFTKLWAIDEILQMALDRFRAAYRAGQFISIDEAMVAFKGCSPIRTYATGLVFWRFFFARFMRPGSLLPGVPDRVRKLA